eukprot:8732417-Alexandrium_andersonii.AAC.1
MAETGTPTPTGTRVHPRTEQDPLGAIEPGTRHFLQAQTAADAPYRGRVPGGPPPLEGVLRPSANRHSLGHGPWTPRTPGERTRQ